MANIKWSSEEIYQLIVLVQERPEIYDQSRPGHCNINVIDKHWREIGEYFVDKNGEYIIITI